MLAAIRTKYGLPGDLGVKEIPIPVPKENEILLRVHATTVNRSDCHVLKGKPVLMRLFTGLFKPGKKIIGSDFAGEIAAVGSAVTSFQVAEKIMGFGGAFGCGSHAQYFTVTESKAKKIMIAMPANTSYEEATACMEGAFYAACQLLPLDPKPGQKALVYGATGAIGTAYLQFLRYFGLQVTAVCPGQHKDLVTALGADKVIDYTKEDFTKDEERYDYIFDAVGKSSFSQCKKLLKSPGVYTSSGGLINLFLLFTTKFGGGKKVVFRFAADFPKILAFIKSLIEKQRFRAVIDRKYPLHQIVDAYRYVIRGQKIGNVVIEMK